MWDIEKKSVINNIADSDGFYGFYFSLSLSFSFQARCLHINWFMILSKAVIGIQKYMPLGGRGTEQGELEFQRPIRAVYSF